MRVAFTAAILCIAVFYTYVAFAGLSFLSSTGRLGPGFFPRIVGVALIATCLYSLWGDLRARRAAGEEEGLSGFWRITVAVAALSGLFVLLLDVLGGLLAMVAYMLATLALLNRGRWLQNLLVATLLPAALYVLFDVWLNAAMPPGIVGFPP
jgi:putative tricarboxylic transport membrane protein